MSNTTPAATTNALPMSSNPATPITGHKRRQAPPVTADAVRNGFRYGGGRLCDARKLRPDPYGDGDLLSRDGRVFRINSWLLLPSFFDEPPQRYAAIVEPTSDGEEQETLDREFRTMHPEEEVRVTRTQMAEIVVPNTRGSVTLYEFYKKPDEEAKARDLQKEVRRAKRAKREPECEAIVRDVLRGERRVLRGMFAGTDSLGRARVVDHELDPPAPRAAPSSAACSAGAPTWCATDA